ncbi:hypothetical protein GCM10023331_20540 [Algivirga pacifica]|uniref:Uncharacterized protein n=1 Tax=Algivirga pacifica TaxID=1162670 RepID=A0ABP9D8V3_9BACT
MECTLRVVVLVVVEGDGQKFAAVISFQRFIVNGLFCNKWYLLLYYMDKTNRLLEKCYVGVCVKKGLQ